MRGIEFNYSPSVSPATMSRMDVACFIGFVPQLTAYSVPPSLANWWKQQGWLDIRAYKDADEAFYDNLPVVIESWETVEARCVDQRQDRQASIRSDALAEVIDIAANDQQVKFVIDGKPVLLELTTDLHGQIRREVVVDNINSVFIRQAINATAEIQTANSSHHIIIRRQSGIEAGGIYVDSNDSIGFPGSRKENTGLLQNYLATAVNAFFRQGGRKCYVVRMGDPLPYEATELQKTRQILKLLWSGRTLLDLSDKFEARIDLLETSFPEIPNSVYKIQDWQGLSHIMSLPDVTYVCLPDLVEICGQHQQAKPASPIPVKPETFVECSKQDGANPWSFIQNYNVPAHSQQSYLLWRKIIEFVLQYLKLNAPFTQLVASLPVPDVSIFESFEHYITNDLLPVDYEEVHDCIYCRLQLAFPWLKTSQSGLLPGHLEPPEGVLLGLLANGTLTQGAYRSIAGSLVRPAYDVAQLDINAFYKDIHDGFSMAERVNWFELSPQGVTLASDVTAVAASSYRLAVVRRIMLLVQRSAYQVGLNHVFDINGQALWQSIEGNLKNLLMMIFQKNALRGRTADDAFSIVCDRCTMTQNDIDNGRLIASVSLHPAATVERITVDLLLDRNYTTSPGGQA
jgi:hypothetical protein